MFALCIDVYIFFRYYNVVTGGPERDIGKRYRGGLLADVSQLSFIRLSSPGFLGRFAE